MPTPPRPDRARHALFRSTRVPTNVQEVARAVEQAIEHASEVYVEHSGDGWRWSPVGRGGVYPLLRMVAQFLRIDYHGIVIGAREVSGCNVLDPETPGIVADWQSILKFAPGTPYTTIVVAIEQGYAGWLALVARRNARRN